MNITVKLIIHAEIIVFAKAIVQRLYHKAITYSKLTKETIKTPVRCHSGKTAIRQLDVALLSPSSTMNYPLRNRIFRKEQIPH